tara:strand:+ start:232 stop:588 length:357 start_codon:yes stop_codon:yes gene_type:complete
MEKILKESESAAYRLPRKLTKLIVTLKLENLTHVPDLMTRIRILESVAVVAQKDKVARFFDGDANLKVSIKYMPESSDILKGIRILSKKIKKLPGVKNIIVHELNKRKLTLKGKRIVI